MQSEINPTRHLGIEIEVVFPIVGHGETMDVQRLLAEVLANHGLATYCRGYNRSPVPRGFQFCVEHDVSLRDESKYAGIRWAKVEIKTAPMTWPEAQEALPPALEIINYLGARCNASTGLHVHHHLPEVVERPEIVRNLQHLWWRFHPVMYGLVAQSRKSNRYCFPPAQADATQYDDCLNYPRLCGVLDQVNRYNGLNLTNLRDRERLTVEWRIHGGTTSFEKIRAWVLATQRWTEHAIARSCHYRPEPIANTMQGLNALLVTTGLKSNSRIYKKVDKELRQVGKFLTRRWKHFNRPAEYKSQATAA